MSDDGEATDYERGLVAQNWGDRLRALREEVTGLVKTIPGPIRSVTVRAEDCSLEITWSRPDARPVVSTEELADAAFDEPAAAAEPTGELKTVTAPLVGTFYVASAPGAAPFVRVGEHVERGQNIGIVEAMKLMNHITSDWAGEVVEIVTSDGAAVEFGQSLVLVRPDAC
jgi:acetyl-CoA carboxylase biotin carboxyl carrier protein